MGAEIEGNAQNSILHFFFQSEWSYLVSRKPEKRVSVKSEKASYARIQTTTRKFGEHSGRDSELEQ